jgi:alpha-beta hydrolase superfamily lysophospholipase
MKRWMRLVVGAVVLLVIIALVAVNVISRKEAIDFVRITPEERVQRTIDEADLIQSPAGYGLPYQDVAVVTSDGLRLVGWYVSSENGAAVMLVPGYEEPRYLMLEEADMLHRHGYGALLLSVRAHDLSDGDLASFGCGDREMADLEAWYQYLLTRDEVDAGRIGILGQSMGGSLVIQYARQNPSIRAVVAHSPFSSVLDTVQTVVTWKTGLPGWLFGPFMVFWASREADCNLASVSAKDWIGDISPRAVFILDAGSDEVVSANSSEDLFAAAGEPKEWWQCQECRHHELDTIRPQEFEEKVVGFFERYLSAP